MLGMLELEMLNKISSNLKIDISCGVGYLENNWQQLLYEWSPINFQGIYIVVLILYKIKT